MRLLLRDRFLLGGRKSEFVKEKETVVFLGLEYDIDIIGVLEIQVFRQGDIDLLVLEVSLVLLSLQETEGITNEEQLVDLGETLLLVLDTQFHLSLLPHLGLLFVGLHLFHQQGTLHLTTAQYEVLQV